MGAGYHQYCPVAKAMEVLDERWTLLVVRELVTGSERFSDLRRGLPHMSPTLLSQRLRRLQRAGVVERREEGAQVRYVLTPAGCELRPVVEALGAWGIRWISELSEDDLDPGLLMWDMHRQIAVDRLPPGRTVVRFGFRGVPVGAASWWLLLRRDGVDVCDRDPGFEPDLRVTAAVRDLLRVWNGEVAWLQAVRHGLVEVDGPLPLRRALPEWLRLSTFAAVPRPPASAGRVRVSGRTPPP